MDSVDEQNADNFASGVEWITTLRCALSNPLEAKYMLDCYIFAEILHRIDDSYFTEGWIDKLSQYDQNSAWRPKTRNLHKLMEKLFSYLREQRHLDLESNSHWKIDEQLFAECGDLAQINKVLYLVVGAAFFGRNKVEFVTTCQQQKPEVQAFVQRSLMTIEEHSQDVSNKSDETVYSADTPRLSNGNGLHSRVDDEDIQAAVDRQVEERVKLEVSRIKEELSNTLEISELRKELNDLKSRKEQLENRAFEAEAEVDTLRMSVDRKDAEIEKFKELSSDSLVLEAENTSLKDELEELRGKEVENGRLTRELEKLKKMIKDSSERKSELNVLREKVDRYMKDAVDLEEEKTKNVTLRQQIASLKVQKDEKEEEANKLSIRLNKLEDELGEVKVRFAISEKKISDAVHEKLLMQDRIKDLENANLESTHVSLSNDATILADSSTSRVFELEKELSHMKERILELEELEQEKREWQLTKGRNSELEAELKISQAKKTEIQERLSVLEEKLDNPDTSQDSGVINGLKMTIEKAGIEYEKLKERFDESERKFAASSDEHQNTQKMVADKDDIIQTRDEQMRKATQLIIDQENRLKAADSDGLSRHEFDSLRKENDQKDKIIHQLKEEMEKIRTKHEEEQRLMTTAYHGMAGRVNEVSRIEQSLESSRDKSFLAKQKASSAYRVSAWQTWIIVVLLLIVMYQNLTTPVSVPPEFI